MARCKSVSLILLTALSASAAAQTPSAPPTNPPASSPPSSPQAEAGEPRADTGTMGDSQSPGQGSEPAGSAKGTSKAGTAKAGNGNAGTRDGAAQGASAGSANGAKPVRAAPPKAASGDKGGAKTDKLDLGLATVTGDHEQPKVMYIVPWKRADIGDLEGKPMNSLVDEILSPVDRDVFKREVVYYQAIQSDTSQNGARASPAPKGEK